MTASTISDPSAAKGQSPTAESIEPFVSAVAMVSAMLLATGLYWSLDGLRYDDSFIFFRVVQHMMEGYGPVWNVGDRFTNSTSALWPTLLALGGLLTGPDHLELLSKTLSYLCECGSSIALFLIIRRSGAKSLAWIAPFAVFLPAHHFVLSGMDCELSLAALLVSLCLYVTDASLYFVAAALAAFYLARPDGIVFAGLLFGDYVFVGFGRLRREAAPGDRLRALVRPALLFAGLCLTWHVYLLASTGSFLPATLHAKIVQGTSGTYWPTFGHDIWPNLLASIDRSAFLLGFAFLGLYGLLRIAPIIAVWAALHLGVYAAAGIAAYAWYYYPLFFLVSLCGFLGIAGVAERGFSAIDRLPKGSPWRLAGLAALAPAVGLFLAAAVGAETGVTTGNAIHWARGLRLHLGHDLDVDTQQSYSDSRRIAHDQVSDWILANRPLSRGETLLTDEIGVVGYRLHDWRIVDEVGMTDPHFERGLIHNWPYYVAQDRPRFIIRNYIHDEPAVMAFRFDPDQYGVYERVFRADSPFIADLYELRTTYGPALGLLNGATLIADVKAAPNEVSSPRFDDLSVYRLDVGRNIEAVVTTFDLDGGSPPPGSVTDRLVHDGRDAIPDDMRQFIATSEWRTGDRLKRVTVEQLPPGHYDAYVSSVSAPRTPGKTWTFVGGFDIPN